MHTRRSLGHGFDISDHLISALRPLHCFSVWQSCTVQTISLICTLSYTAFKSLERWGVLKVILNSNNQSKNRFRLFRSREGRVGPIDPVNQLAIMPNISAAHLKYDSIIIVIGYLVVNTSHLSPWREKGSVQGGLSSSVNGQSCLGAFAKIYDYKKNQIKKVWNHKICVELLGKKL